jgi:hypothetical protein
MNRAIAAAALAGLLAQASASLAQPRGRAERGADPFARCAPVAAPAALHFGTLTRYSRCLPDVDVDQYAQAFVSYDPPSNPSVGSGGLFSRIGGLFAQNQRHGAVILILSVDGRPLDTIVLSEFEAQGSNRVRFLNQPMQNHTIRFRPGKDSNVTARLIVHRSTTVVSNVVSLARSLGSALARVNLISAALDGAVLDEAANLERQLVAALGSSYAESMPIRLGFRPADQSGFLNEIRLTRGENDAPARLRVALTYSTSLLGSPLVAADGKSLSFDLAGWSILQTDPILDRPLLGSTLRRLVERRMGEEYEALSSADADAIERSCKSLVQALRSPDLNLTVPDRLLAQWAFLARNGRMADRAVRDGPCLAEVEPAFAELGLPLPAVEAAEVVEAQ